MSNDLKADGPQPGSQDETRNVGRGALYLTATKFWFLVSGYVIYFALPRLLGGGDVGKDLFGKYSVVTGFGAIFNALVIQGTTQAVSRFVGRDPGNADGVRRAAYRLQSLIGGSLFLLLFLTAPITADRLYGDSSLTWPLRCASFILLFYAFYAVFMGYLNGRKMFARQALADFSYSTLKIVGVLGGAFLVYKGVVADPDQLIVAPVAGFAGAAGLVTLLAMFLSGRARGPGTTPVRELFNFQLFTMLFTVAATTVGRGDLQVLRVMLQSDKNVDTLAAEYTAAQAFATIPFQAVFAITFILFPLVSGAAGRDPDLLRGYIRQTTRYAGMIAAMIVALFFACPERTITILFPADYIPAALPLRLLSVGYLCYSVFFISCAVITASGRPRVSLGMVAVVLAIQLTMGASLARGHYMNGVALATMVAMVTGLALAHFCMKRMFGQGLVAGTMVRILGCAVITGGVAHFLLARSTFLGGAGFLANIGGTGIVAKAVTVGGFGALCLVYLGLLLFFGVLDADDRAKLRRVLKR